MIRAAAASSASMMYEKVELLDAFPGDVELASCLLNLPAVVELSGVKFSRDGVFPWLLLRANSSALANLFKLKLGFSSRSLFLSPRTSNAAATSFAASEEELDAEMSVTLPSALAEVEDDSEGVEEIKVASVVVNEEELPLEAILL